MPGADHRRAMERQRRGRAAFHMGFAAFARGGRKLRRIGRCDRRRSMAGQPGQTGKPASADVRLRAAVVNDRLLVNVEGATTGTLSVWVARGEPGDGENGELGCAPAAARGVSTSSVELGSGKVSSHGPNAPLLSIHELNATGVQLVTESIAGIGRLALSYRSSDGALLATAALPLAPQARDLPPLAPVLPGERWCQALAGRLDSRPENAATDPAVRLR